MINALNSSLNVLPPAAPAHRRQYVCVVSAFLDRSGIDPGVKQFCLNLINREDLVEPMGGAIPPSLVVQSLTK